MKEKQQPSALNYISPFVLITLGSWHYARHGVDILTIIPIGLGCFSLYLVLFNLPLLQRALTLLTKIWYPIGQLIGLSLFAVTFYVVFAPVGLLLRLFKKDILHKEIKPDVSSYWIDRTSKEPNNYTQQF